MSIWFFVLTILFVVVSTSMVLIILVQRPSGGGLAGAFGGAGGGGTDSVFGGRVGDALTMVTIAAFLIYLGLSITLNLMPIRTVETAQSTDTSISAPADSTATPSATTATPSGSTGGGTQIELKPLDAPPPGFGDDATLTPIIIPPAEEPEGTTSDPGGTPDGGSE